MHTILNFLSNMFTYMLISFPIIIIFKVLHIFFKKKIGKKIFPFHEIALIIFSVYIVGVLSQTILPKHEFTENGIHFFEEFFDDRNFIPFKMLYDSWINLSVYRNYTFIFVNLVGNIILFFPIGFFLPLLWNKINNLTITLSICAALSIFIEIIQIPMKRGTDIDDFLLNVLGAFLGFLLYRLVDRLFPKFCKKFKTTD